MRREVNGMRGKRWCGLKGRKRVASRPSTPHGQSVGRLIRPLRSAGEERAVRRSDDWGASHVASGVGVVRKNDEPARKLRDPPSGSRRGDGKESEREGVE